MSFEISEEVLKALEEKLREFRNRASSGIPLGEERKMIAIDARVGSREVQLACLVDGQERVLVARLDDKVTEIVYMLQDLKCVELRARVFGNRITEIISYSEYSGKLPPKYMGVLRKARSGVRYWLDTVDGKESLLIGDFSIKGMKLNGEASEGDLVVMYAFNPETTKANIRVITYLHYQIVKPVEKKEEHEETEKEETVEEAGPPREEIEKIAEEEKEEERGKGEEEESREREENVQTISVSEGNGNPVLNVENVEGVRRIVRAVLGEDIERTLFKDEENVKMCIDYTRNMVEVVLCLIDNAELSRKMKQKLVEDFKKRIGSLVENIR
ncbi:MAG: hypothetical protein GXO26_08070 [Crenarchaeota archaeon]|nr:hypothetical protein [Thermoproteota archaeon]